MEIHKSSNISQELIAINSDYHSGIASDSGAEFYHNQDPNYIYFVLQVVPFVSAIFHQHINH